MLSTLDVGLYPVCKTAKGFLRDVFAEPTFDVSVINPGARLGVFPRAIHSGSGLVSPLPHCFKAYSSCQTPTSIVARNVGSDLYTMSKELADVKHFRLLLRYMHEFVAPCPDDVPAAMRALLQNRMYLAGPYLLSLS